MIYHVAPSGMRWAVRRGLELMATHENERLARRHGQQLAMFEHDMDRRATAVRVMRRDGSLIEEIVFGAERLDDLLERRAAMSRRRRRSGGA